MQLLTYLTTVNIGSWSALKVRDMAIEADCKDFYDFVYSGFSSATHNMWPHIASYNLEQCTNPLHGWHGVPRVKKVPWDIHYLYLSAKYVQKAFTLFDEKLKISIKEDSAFKYLCDWLSEDDSEKR